ncbi:hypothetical protein FSW04_01065 [Baekduia soli]|uniref:Uncharacterized protein n=1 Tax=Baekduia soli TaxID=496014 RepID=A0A5B8U006_9ACTN|nr:DUF5317 family protein [Baekduia soli]QEC46302.1 hypothetical protein FSW04_01065 [Baekduia soli]
MLLGAVLILGILSVPLTGGNLVRAADVRFRRRWAIIAALLGQIVVIEILPGGSPALHQGAHLATYALAAVFIVSNVRITGVGLMGLGGGLNLLAIAANHGIMPARAGALRTAGLAPPPGHFANSAVVSDAHLRWLGDVFAVPSWVPLANVYSVGDVLLLIGAVGGLHAVCGSRPATWVRAHLRPRALHVEAVEVVAVGSGPALLRVRGRGAATPAALVLVVEDDRRGPWTVAALASPAPPGTQLWAGFAVPGGPEALDGCRLSLRSGRRTIPLPPARPRRLGPVAAAA